MVIQASLMGESYGKTPAEILFAPGTQSPMERFRFNADAHAAASQFKADEREKEQENQETSQQGAGSATAREKEQLLQQTHDRADQRERMEQSDSRVEDTSTQLDALAAKQREREEAREAAGLDAAE